MAAKTPKKKTAKKKAAKEKPVMGYIEHSFHTTMAGKTAASAAGEKGEDDLDIDVFSEAALGGLIIGGERISSATIGTVTHLQKVSKLQIGQLEESKDGEELFILDGREQTALIYIAFQAPEALAEIFQEATPAECIAALKEVVAAGLKKISHWSAAHSLRFNRWSKYVLSILNGHGSDEAHARVDAWEGKKKTA
jgi:hypothetical protein